MRSEQERETERAEEGLVTGELQDTWKGIHRRLRAEHELV